MTVRAVYEDGVFKPRDRVDLEEHTEVQLDVREEPKSATDDDDAEARSFVGFITEGRLGFAVARDHDDYLDGRDDD